MTQQLRVAEPCEKTEVVTKAERKKKRVRNLHSDIFQKEPAKTYSQKESASPKGGTAVNRVKINQSKNIGKGREKRLIKYSGTLKEENPRIY